MNKKNISEITWLNIFLLTINVCFIVAFLWYFIKSDTKLDPRIRVNSNELLKKELNLSPEQYKDLNILDLQNSKKRQKTLRLLCKERIKLLKELLKNQPSKDSLNKIITKTGYLYRGLLYQNTQHLLNIKKICNQEQEDQMNKVFREFLQVDNQCKYCKDKCERGKSLEINKKN